MKKRLVKIIEIIMIIGLITLSNFTNGVQAVNEVTSTQTTSSTNANLSNLGVTAYDFTGFQASQTTYSTIVPDSVTSVSVYAVTQDKNATYSVSGNTNLKDGVNTVIVTVTAADKKTQKNYYINVTRGKDKTGTSSNDSDKLKVVSIAIEGNSKIELQPEFKSDVYKYKIKIDDSDQKEKITKIPLKVISNKNDASIIVSGNENLKDGENTIKITASTKEGKDKVEYQIIVRKNMPEEVEEETTENQVSNIDQATLSTPHIQYGWYIIGGILILFTIILIIIIIVGRKNKKAKRKAKETEDWNNDMEKTQIYNIDNIKKGKHF